ncbi:MULTISPECIES: hypothetical protein [Rhodococcus]|uniref:hypothetical protein n=1 Tax=Rhodococcus TaxID=1827 RepID=UPI0010E865F4|nr:hypothetical protein [Rhodococcus opacus]NHU47067.1 hypothetical protein [Rhodococcus sp. A14]RYF39177.1 MAG: hypothetical protein EOO27_49605 [Comamonadaceae bacterium]UZG59721.1 hypothetical protein ONE62_38875 [Rhodococcus opacus]
MTEAQGGRDPQDLIVLLDLEFLIATDARTARAELALRNSGSRTRTTRRPFATSVHLVGWRA